MVEDRWGNILTGKLDRGLVAGTFGVAAVVFAIFYFSDVPRVSKDIMLVRHH